MIARRGGVKGATFVGGPCKSCGGTLRYTAQRRCVACDKSRSKRRKRSKLLQKCYQLRRLYGITLEQKEDLLAMQGGGCALCSKLIAGYDAVVDHDHATGRVRGILCRSHNTALGQFNDDPAMLRAAAAYLEAGSESVERRARPITFATP